VEIENLYRPVAIAAVVFFSFVVLSMTNDALHYRLLLLDSRKMKQELPLCLSCCLDGIKKKRKEKNDAFIAYGSPRRLCTGRQ
jgi:hypothetical protein